VRAEIVVVGAGIMGSATAYALARIGHEVLLVEQYEVGHEHGSSHGRSRIVRLAYPEVEFVELAKEAFAGWRELERESGQELLELNGLLELVEDPAQSSHDALAAAGAEYELLTADEARRRWPVGVPDGWTALFQPEGGIVRADLALRALVDGAVSRGATLEENTRVDSLDDVDAKVVVVTAGSWVTKLVPDVPVRTTRETVAYFAREGDPLPSVVQLDPETRGHAMYSLHDPLHGLKAGAHHQGAAVDPDTDAGADPALVERITEWVGRTYLDGDPRPVAAETCMYTTTADEHFILERRGRVVIGSPCSGHGFKFAPAIGKRLAALAADIL
jgi:sarcosine oxidase